MERIVLFFTNISFCGLYKKEWTLVGENNKSWNGEDVVIDKYHRMLTTPQGCAYIAIQTGSINNSDWGPYDVSATLMVEEGNHASQYAEYNGGYVTRINGYPIKANDNEREVRYDIPMNTYILGDSIATYVEGLWPQTMVQKFSFKNFSNLAVGGATWGIRKDATLEGITGGNSASPNNNMLTKVYKLIDDVTNNNAPIPELIIIHAGTNDVTSEFARHSTTMAGDANGTAIGDADDTFDYSDADYRDWSSLTATDVKTNTISGGMRITIEKIRSQWPYCKIVVTTPTQRSTNVSGDYSLTAYYWQAVDEIKKSAKYLAVPVIDLACESGVCPYNFSVFLKDGLHPNSNGGKRYADIIGRWLVAHYGFKSDWLS